MTIFRMRQAISIVDVCDRFDLDRRHLLSGMAIAAGLCLLMAKSAIGQTAAVPESAASIRERIVARLKAAVSDPEIVATARAFRERYTAVIGGIESLGSSLTNRRPSSKTEISKFAVTTIIDLEVSGEDAYTAHYQGPEVPGSYSGVTIGIGYDIGQITPQYFKDDWQGLIPDDVIERLSEACGKTKQSAKEVMQSLLDVKIPWQVANEQFLNRTLPLYVADTEAVFKNTNKLHPDSLGALVSLIYNRGTSFSTTNANGEDTRPEMRNIRDLMAEMKFSEIPEQFRAMKWVWDKDHGNYSRGLLDRRDTEADLFAHGFAQSS
jgi:GH24 family phage-related lysozyme (muramidase)